MTETQAMQLSMPAAEYFASAGLSFSMMKDLAVSPLRLWYLHLNPDKPERRETAEMRFGSALHCAVLEPAEFTKRYVREIDKSDVEGCLVTADDLRQFLKDKGVKHSAKNKAELVGLVQAVDRNAPIFDVIEKQHEIENAAKVQLSAEDWDRVRTAAESLRSEPSLIPILEDPAGRSEVSMTAIDPNTKVLLKGRLDWVTPSLTLDIKTFSQQRGKPIDKCVHDAIYYEHYNWQAYHYTNIRAINGDRKPRYVMAFVESDQPHEVRLKELRPVTREVNYYWERGRADVQCLIYKYAQCLKQFGDKPWREDRMIELLMDDDVPQFAFDLGR